ncbi:MAG: hypothetical protein KDD58_11795 [Bdellovibrionales bacterium]|nr:hypothetical protein [Bdellovibrionales bacterium]
MSQAINLKTYKQAKNLADTVKAVENQTLNVIEVYREIEVVKKNKSVNIMSSRYHIKNPSKTRGKGKRASFSIFLAKPQVDGTTKTETVQNADVESINNNYLAGIYDWETARKNIEQIRNRLNAEIGKFTLFTGNKTNGRVLEKYWQEEYQGRKIKEESMSSAKHDLRRALDAIGKVSIVSGSAKEIQKAIDASGFDVTKQRRIIARLNQILKFLGRKDVRLHLPKKSRIKVKFLSVEEFQKVLALEPREEIRALYEVCFYTGARLGREYFNKRIFKVIRKSVIHESMIVHI